jgi:hypothetical protein
LNSKLGSAVAAYDLIVMIVMHGKDMHEMFARIEQVDPMFAV